MRHKFQAQFELVNSPLKTFRNLAKLRQRDDNMAFSAMKLAPLTNDLIMFSRIHHVDNTTTTIGAVSSLFLIINLITKLCH